MSLPLRLLGYILIGETMALLIPAQPWSMVGTLVGCLAFTFFVNAKETK